MPGLTWVGQGSTVKLRDAGLELADPLAYFWADPRGQNPEPATIDLRLPVSMRAVPAAYRELGYWPRYDQLTPEQRRIYLDWIAAGRKQIPPELGYTFLFIYGLERRALVDRQDAPLIFDEVVRLRSLYQTSGEKVSRSFDTYTSSFLWFLLVRDGQELTTARFAALARSMSRWNEDYLSSALAVLGRAGFPLPDWMAFALAEQLPNAQRGVVLKRVGEEMRELFAKRFAQRFPSGMTLKGGRSRRFTYRPASAALPQVEVVAPHPMGTTSQFNVIVELWNDCVADLKRLSSVVGADRDNADALTVETWTAMPAELRAEVDHPLTQRFSEFIAERTGDSPHTLVTARDVATLVGVEPSAKLTPAVSRRVAAAVHNVGYCVEPDAALAGRGYDADETLALFLNLSENEADPQRYNAASLMLRVGFAMAAADGKVDEGELALVTQQLDSAFELNDHEERRLEQLRAIIAAKGIEFSDVSKPLRKLPLSQRELISKFALALVAADGVVTKAELKAVRRLCTAMDFERSQIDVMLRSIMAVGADASQPAASDDDPVAVSPAVLGATGERIPSPPVETVVPAGLRLDRAAIAAILRDTQEVSKMLADAMNVDQSHSEEKQKTASEPAPAVPPAAAPAVPVDSPLPQRYAAFYQVVVTRPDWPRGEISELAKKHGLMLSGAIEAINDWSTEKHGGPLVYEDDQRFTLEPAYLQ